MLTNPALLGLPADRRRRDRRPPEKAPEQAAATALHDGLFRRLASSGSGGIRHIAISLFARDIDHAALGLDQCQDPAVQPIYVAAKLQMTVIVHEGSLIGQMHRNGRREGDVLLLGAEHPLDPLFAV